MHCYSLCINLVKFSEPTRIPYRNKSTRGTCYIRPAKHFWGRERALRLVNGYNITHLDNYANIILCINALLSSIYALYILKLIRLCTVFQLWMFYWTLEYIQTKIVHTKLTSIINAGIYVCHAETRNTKFYCKPTVPFSVWNIHRLEYYFRLDGSTTCCYSQIFFNRTYVQ